MTSALTYSSDGKYLVSSVTGTNELIVWDAESDRFITRHFIPELKWIGGAEFIVGTHQVLIGGDSGIYAYDIGSGAIELIQSGYTTRYIGAIDVTPSGDSIAWIAANDEYGTEGKFYLLNVKTQEIDSMEVYFRRHPAAMSAPRYLASKDLTTVIVATGGNEYRIITNAVDTVIEHTLWEPLELSRNGEYVIVLNHNTYVLDTLDLNDLTMHPGTQVHPTTGQSDWRIGDYSDIHEKVAFADNRAWFTPEYGVNDGYIMIAENGDTTNITGLVGDVAVSPISPEIVVGGRNGMARYDLEGRIDQLNKTDNGEGISNLSISSTGELSYILRGDFADDFSHGIIVGSRNFIHHMAGAGFKCFNTPKIDPIAPRFALGVNIYKLDTIAAWMQCPIVTSEWTPSGSHYVWSAFNDTLVVQDRNGRRSYYPTGHRKVNSIAVSRNGLIATAGEDSLIRVWTVDGALQHTFSGHNASVNDVNFAPNGNQLVSASDDSTVRVWTLGVGERHVYDEFNEPFTQAAVSHDGLTVVAATPYSVVAFDASDWASVRKPSPTPTHLTATRTAHGIRLHHDLSTNKAILVEIYDLLGRMLYRGEHLSIDGKIAVNDQAIARQLLLVIVRDGERSASAIVQ